MMRTRVILLTVAVGLVLLPLAGAAAVVALTGQPGVPQVLELSLGPRRGLLVHLQPCRPDRPGRVTVWYVDGSRPNRLNPSNIHTLLGVRTAPPCS
jgi:hypothetical protein